MCENEPSNDGYYGSSPISDYLNLLRVLVRVAHEYGIKVADGAVFVEYINLLTTGSWPSRVDANVKQNKEILSSLSEYSSRFLSLLTMQDFILLDFDEYPLIISFPFLI